MAESATHVNFYENIAEVGIRLTETIVMYDGKPYFVLGAAEHVDGIIRLYLDDLTHPLGLAHQRLPVPYKGGYSMQKDMDNFLKLNPDCGVVRKMMNSPHFNKFRPFPLGMCNYGGKVSYIERAPQRHTHQGLTQQMLHYTDVNLNATMGKGSNRPMYISKEFAACIMGQYPSLDECIENLLDPRNSNEGAAFHRSFALIRGPMDSLYIAYKSDVVGLLTYADRTEVRLGKAYKHARQAIQDLRMFQTVE